MKKKIVFLFLLCLSAFWCYAEEGGETGKDNQTALFFPSLSLSETGFGGSFTNQTFFSNDHSTFKPTLGIGKLEWRQADFKLTKYSSGGSGATDAGTILGITLGVIAASTLLGLMIVLAME
jgi:hypothetical protein